MIKYIFFVLVLFSLNPLHAKHYPLGEEVKVAWHVQYPYQYIKEINNHFRPTGIDIEIARAVTRQMNHLLTLEKIPWNDQLNMLKQKKVDVVISALMTPKRFDEFLFSKAYRTEQSTLCMLQKGSEGLGELKNVAELIQYLQAHELKLGVVEGYAYTSELLNKFIANKENAQYLVFAANETANFFNLLNGKVDASVSFWLVANSLIYENHWSELLTLNGLDFDERDVYFIFNKDDVQLQNSFNNALQVIREEGIYGNIISTYLYPILINQTVSTWWYVWIVIIGTITYTIYALRHAFTRNFNLFGAMVIAIVFALGGGLIRDIIASRERIFFVSDPSFIYIVSGTTLGIFVFYKLYKYLHQNFHEVAISHTLNKLTPKVNRLFFDYIFNFLDALGLASFTVFGVLVALETQAAPLLLWGPLLAVLTASGGGLLVDVILNNSKGSFYGTYYPEISAAWGFFLSAMLSYQADKGEVDYIFIAIIVTLIGALLSRLLVIRYKFKGPSFS